MKYRQPYKAKKYELCIRHTHTHTHTHIREQNRTHKVTAGKVQHVQHKGAVSMTDVTGLTVIAQWQDGGWGVLVSHVIAYLFVRTATERRNSCVKVGDHERSKSRIYGDNEHRDSYTGVQFLLLTSLNMAKVLAMSE
jgi:hypothetical protein